MRTVLCRLLRSPGYLYSVFTLDYSLETSFCARQVSKYQTVQNSPNYQSEFTRKTSFDNDTATAPKTFRSSVSLLFAKMIIAVNEAIADECKNAVASIAAADYNFGIESISSLLNSCQNRATLHTLHFDNSRVNAKCK